MVYSVKIFEGRLFIDVPTNTQAWREFYNGWKTAFETSVKEAQLDPEEMRLTHMKTLNNIRAGYLANLVCNRVFEEILEDRQTHGLDIKVIHDAFMNKRHVTFVYPEGRKEFDFPGYSVYFEPSPEHEFPGYKWPDQQIEAYQNTPKTPEDWLK